MSGDADAPSGRRALIAAYDQHHAAIGRIANGWAELHENLCAVFLAATKIDSAIGGAIWHSIRSDLGQRQMLSEVLKAPVDPDHWSTWPRLHADAKWLLEAIKSFMDPRNDAVHTHFMMSLIGFDSDAAFRPSPMDFYGNPRARRLRSKSDLASEFAWYAASIRVLSDFAEELAAALRDAEHPWPTKPSLPPRPSGRTGS